MGPGGEARLGRSARGLAANSALQGLSRCARSVPLYAPGSASVRNLVVEYRQRMREALAHGDMELQVRPLEFVLDGEVVFLERARDRSLPLLFFRDGVRVLTIRANSTWEEQVRLLEIAILRSRGFAAKEDDVVTLFWKSGFTSVSITAVEGFVEDDEDDGALAPTTVEEGDDTAGLQPEEPGTGAARFGRTEVPRDWDLPMPDTADLEAAVAWREVSSEKLAQLRSEVTPETVPALALRMSSELVELASDLLDPTTFTEVAHQLVEVRDYLLSVPDLGMNALFWRRLREVPARGQEVAQTVLRGCAGERVARMILSWARELQENPPKPSYVRAEVDRLPTDCLPALLAAVAIADDVALREAGLSLLVAWLPDREAPVLEWLQTAPAPCVVRLLPELLRAHPTRHIDLLTPFVGRDEPAVVEVVDALLASANAQVDDVPALTALLESTRSSVRLGALRLLAQVGDRNVAAALLERVRTSSSGRFRTTEFAALGECIGRLDGARLAGEVETWLRPPGLWKRIFGGLPTNQGPLWAGVALLVVVDPARHAPAIRWMARRAGPELQRYALRSLVGTAARREDG
ncbi:MAG: HEAT repeat domain-containing protein [Pseudomonadota bacterium]|nr:HEAT repeat domain-containing protein [Pseudomonadota bacterium]